MIKKRIIGEKIVIVGTTGSGKTTFAGRLSVLTGIPHFELDGLFWKPDWQEAPREEFREKIISVTDKSKWIIDGNYAWNQDITIGRADTVIWLDCSKLLSLYRVLTRSLRRIINKKPLWQNNKESLIRIISPKNSILFFAWRSYIKKKNRYNKLFAGESTLNLIRITGKRDENEFWNNLKKNPA